MIGGAEIGTAILPGVGTVVGGAVGFGVGWWLADKAYDAINSDPLQSTKQARKESHDAYKAFQRQGYERDPNDPCQELRNKIAFHEQMIAARTAHDMSFPNPGWPDGKRHADVNDFDSENVTRWKKELEDCEKSCKR
ncbi:hypothetical protein [Solimicrobium silvestre]|uniref:Uncharacterized protein n=1 Tax=Solimicrobium silvestre TaxID=2099400 RepID=A0A2S9GSC3_9BURK|nr:hypothetical protein [Solimicrobium silvestre]PRC90613.1 hypothetical protein S2091_4681 [Solimicrobium silvestre]